MGSPDAFGPLPGVDSPCCGFYLRNGDGTFGPYISVVDYTSNNITQFSPAFFLAADMTGDGKQDIIMGEGSIPGVFTLINTTTPVTVNLSPGSLGFGPQLIGVPSSVGNITLINTGNLPLTISSIGIKGANSGDFSQTTNCPDSVPVDSGCTIRVTFTPTAVGHRNAAATITDNAPNSPQSIRLSGIGEAGKSSNLALSVAPGGSSSATVAAGVMATYKLTIGGAGFSGTASLTCTGAPQAANCSFSSGATINVSASSATPFNVTVITTSRSMAALSPASTGSHSWLWTVALIGIVILPNAKRKECAAWRIIRLSPLLLLVLLGACGGGGGSTSTSPPGTPAGTYALTVTATSGSVNQSLPLTLTVQ